MVSAAWAESSALLWDESGASFRLVERSPHPGTPGTDQAYGRCMSPSFFQLDLCGFILGVPLFWRYAVDKFFHSVHGSNSEMARVGIQHSASSKPSSSTPAVPRMQIWHQGPALKNRVLARSEFNMYVEKHK